MTPRKSKSPKNGSMFLEILGFVGFFGIFRPIAD